jgi:catechol 2,3-dioxygenase-like lactoylglutathione lyase family enzyme
MKVRRVLETCLYVDDLEKAEAFYRRVFGLEVYGKVEGRHVFFRCGSGMFLLFNPGKTSQPGGTVPAHGSHGGGHAAFAMSPDEIPGWREHLLHEGVAIEKEITWPSGGYSIYLRDPAGNSVELATPQTWKNLAEDDTA